MYRLGAQGRAAQQKLLTQQHITSKELAVPALQAPSQAQNDVNMLLSILRSKNSEHLRCSALLSYVVHYFPKVKNTGNLKLLGQALFKNDTIFNRVANIDDDYLIIEAFKALFDNKLEISEPTIPVTEFFHTIVSTLYEAKLEPWRKMLVITGLVLSKPRYEAYSVPETRSFFEKTYQSLINLNHELSVIVFKNVLVNRFEINTVCCIALACSLPFFNKHQKSHLPHDSIMNFTSSLLFQSPLGLKLGNTEELGDSKSPVLKHMSRLPFLIENCLVNGVSYPIIEASFRDIVQFSISLYSRAVNNPKSWDFLKRILFSIVIIFQGFSSFSLDLFNGLKQDQLAQISEHIMKTLFYLNFIIEKMGTGGFKAYNYVYITTIDGLFQKSLKKAESLGFFFSSSVNVNRIPSNYYETSKALFALTYFESLSMSCSEHYYNSMIHPFVTHMINNPKQSQSPEFTHSQRSIIEASHSVILSTFKNPKNSLVITTTAISYLHTVLSQFPMFLSPHQLKLAVETVARSIAPPTEAYYLNTDNFRELLHTLYMTVLNTDSRLPIPLDQPSGNGPSTVRAGLIDCLIAVLPYVHASRFNDWLNNIWGLVEASNTSEEYLFLEDSLWKMISEGLDIQRGNIGIQWWYSHRDLVSKL